MHNSGFNFVTHLSLSLSLKLLAYIHAKTFLRIYRNINRTLVEDCR